MRRRYTTVTLKDGREVEYSFTYNPERRSLDPFVPDDPEEIEIADVQVILTEEEVAAIEEELLDDVRATLESENEPELERL